MLWIEDINHGGILIDGTQTVMQLVVLYFLFIIDL